MATDEKETQSPARSQGDWKEGRDWDHEGLQVVTEQDGPNYNERPDVRRVKTVQFEQAQMALPGTPDEPQGNGKWRRLEDDNERDGRRVMGLRAPIFWMLVVIFVLLLAGGIGGGVAAVISAQSRVAKKQNMASQFTASSFTLPSPAGAAPSSSAAAPISSSIVTSTSVASAPGSSASPALTSPCDAKASGSKANGTIITASDVSGQPYNLNSTPHNFTLLCNTNFPAGGLFGNPNTEDLMSIYPNPPSMQGCVNACVQYNLGVAVKEGAKRCMAVAIVKAPGSWCYFKSGTGQNDTSSSLGVPVDSAVLLGL